MSKAASIVVLAAGFIAIAALIAYSASSYHSFLNVEGLIIVVGGSIANAFLSYKRDDVLTAFSAVRHLLDPQDGARDALHRDIMQLIGWAYVVQAEDMIGLERESAKTVRDPLLRYGIDLVVTGYSPEKIREMLHTVAEAEFERGCAPVTVLRNMAATAPAFGMVGTLIGMVTLLNNVGADLSNIGGGLAIAMLSTLYGLLTARLVCLPAADKLLQQEEMAHFRTYMLTEGLVLLAEKQRPVYMQDRLNSFLEPARHIDLHTIVDLAPKRRYAMAA